MSSIQTHVLQNDRNPTLVDIHVRTSTAPRGPPRPDPRTLRLCQPINTRACFSSIPSIPACRYRHVTQAEHPSDKPGMFFFLKPNAAIHQRLTFINPAAPEESISHVSKHSAVFICKRCTPAPAVPFYSRTSIRSKEPLWYRCSTQLATVNRQGVKFRVTCFIDCVFVGIRELTKPRYRRQACSVFLNYRSGHEESVYTNIHPSSTICIKTLILSITLKSSFNPLKNI